MKAFTQHQGLVAPLDRPNVDTDAIIPKQFLKAISKTGYGPFLFDDWRYTDGGGMPGQDCSQRPLNPDFVLNQTRYQGASILLTRDNFGCGSSREHAAWALADYGFRCVIAPSFADIFHGNAVSNGILPVRLDAETVERLFQECFSAEGYRLTVDLEARTIETPGGEAIAFEVEDGIRHRLLNGLDDIGITLQSADAIRDYEQRRKQEKPWLYTEPA
ncbi:3-isopropylmalate dehydratase small subunit [Methylonatrum kenyense]|uniref:3-isopropylmalate dehydratase small subunit n=1 Tax=Methylonatrum kenyense TaxID=455253 RepID=UPI0020BFF19B|nr:3-isopropylmalate dehydratase small subunit [Methylonatrum kenyense]MCK8514932.1 3-isopropylmalate dehydratase small subunit [Methylonatrum kenyense]